MKFAILALLFATNAWAAKTTETFSVPVQSFEGLNYHCTPGVEWNGHNFPTNSMADIFIWGHVPTYNITNVYSLGPDDNMDLLGDHCAEIEQYMRSKIPSTMNVTRTFTDSCEFTAGEKVRVVKEEVIVHVAGMSFSDSKSLIAGKCN